MSRKRSQRTECLADLMCHSSLLQFSSLTQASGKFKYIFNCHYAGHNQVQCSEAFVGTVLSVSLLLQQESDSLNS